MHTVFFKKDKDGKKTPHVGRQKIGLSLFSGKVKPFVHC